MLAVAVSVRWFHSIPFIGSWLLRRQVARKVVLALAQRIIDGGVPCLCQPKADGEKN